MTRLGKPFLIAFAIVLLIGLALIFRETIGLALQGHREAKLATRQAGAAIANGRDAVAATGDVGARADETDDLTRRNDHEIRSAPGAELTIDDGVRDAGLRALCLRRAYRGDSQCLRFAAPAPVEGSGARRADP